MNHPKTISSVEHLDDLLSSPSDGVIESLRHMSGDFLVLGVGGKMGPSLARMIRRALDRLGSRQRVIGVARFTSTQLPQQLHSWGVETIRADLLKEADLNSLPRVDNVVFMTGMKFGATGQAAMTWAMNAYLPALVSQTFRHSRIVALASGNVYGMCPVSKNGSIESDPLNPVGEYAMSCLGRERMFEHFSRTLSIPMSVIRLNYATEMRYGVLVDLARAVAADSVIDLAMGHVNVIWQGDASAATIQTFAHVSVPPFVLNVAGPDILSVRRVCEQFGERLGKSPKFIGVEADNALLNNAATCHRLFGPPRVGVERLIDWTADWVKRGGPFLDKPTHFASRDGKF